MSTRTIISLCVLLGLGATGCPESKTETAPEPKSPDESAGAAEAPATAEGAKEEGKDEEGGW
jgi:hypothetical protein